MDARKIIRKPTIAGDSLSTAGVQADDRFSAAVNAIAKRYGVKVAQVSPPTKNPYAMSPEEAAEIAVQAGIITRSGKLKFPFK